MDAYLDLYQNQLVAGGYHEGIGCRPKACLVSEESCAGGKFFSPGCCAGPDCPLETKCGDQCSPTDSCHLKDPINRTCVLSECYTCDQKDGKDLYSVEDKYFEFDCVEFGTAIRPENGQMYKWAIFCGPTRQGMYDDNAEYPDDGEYQCGAVRLGANFSDDSGGLVAATFPCKFIAQTECGCGSNSTCLRAVAHSFARTRATRMLAIRAAPFPVTYRGGKARMRSTAPGSWKAGWPTSTNSMFTSKA
jgi:hypothetical protein